jgi:hypothetical protein
MSLGNWKKLAALLSVICISVTVIGCGPAAETPTSGDGTSASEGSTDDGGAGEEGGTEDEGSTGT